jgi:branched-chain amino acid transport system permease protein
MALTRRAPAQTRVEARPAAAPRPTVRGLPEIDNPAAWIVAVVLLLMPAMANGFFLTEIFATALILGTSRSA